MKYRLEHFVRVSERNPRYFELEDGSPFIPVGVNLCFQRFTESNEEVFALYKRDLEAFAANGGNFMRVWTGVPFLDLEPEKAGAFDAGALDRMERLVDMADSLGIRLKFTFDHFRRMDDKPEAELFPGAAKFRKTVYRRANGAFADDMTEFFMGAESRANFVAKLELLSKRFAHRPAIMAWELWNEINAVAAPDSAWMSWTEAMLKELRRLFPKQLALQSLGSYCSLSQQHKYDWLCGLEDNAFSQAHRYLDPGAELDVCRGPMDVLCADSIRELLSKAPGKPAILAETGAVEWLHCRMSHLYELDKKGMLLHDELFAPFFAGSAGCGHSWHWDFYIARNDLWRHFRLFAKAVEGLDPVAEDFKPFFRDSKRLRVYGLKGRSLSVLWCRDKLNTWDLELERGQAPERLDGLKLDLRDLDVEASGEASFYMPWADAEAKASLDGTLCALPPFERSLVARLSR